MALPTGDQLLEPNAAVRVVRLCQITSGHIGHGPIARNNEDYLAVEVAEMMNQTEDLSSEKLDWCVKYLTEECQARYVIVWCRWRRERERLVKLLNNLGGTMMFGAEGRINVLEIYGGQKQSERDFAIRYFSASSDDKAKFVLVAQPHAGGHGLNLIAATEVIYLSNDWSLGIRLQSEDRCHRPGQKHPVTYIDVLATGPKGQQSIDHIVYKALIRKQELAHLTASAWRQKLEEDNW